MKVIALASQKGGAGKTTLAGHLAVAAAEGGLRPCLVDTDPQGTLTAWCRERERGQVAPLPLRTVGRGGMAATLAGAKELGVDVVIVDTPPAVDARVATTLAFADLVLLPVRPSPHDLRAVGATLALTDEAGKPALLVVNAAPPRSRMGREAVAALAAHGGVLSTIITARVGFAASMTDGRTVLELEPRGVAAEEVREVWSAVWRALVTRTPAKRRAKA